MTETSSNLSSDRDLIEAVLADASIGSLARWLGADLAWKPQLPNFFRSDINFENWLIQIQLRPDLPDQIGRRNNFFAAVFALLRHEEGHWRICPFAPQDHLSLRSAVERAWLQVAERFHESVSSTKAGGICHAVVNMFADLIVDRVNYEEDERYCVGTAAILNILSREIDPSSEPFDYFLLQLRKGFILQEEVNPAIAGILNTLRGDLRQRDRWPKIAYRFAYQFFLHIIQQELIDFPGNDETPLENDGMGSKTVPSKGKESGTVKANDSDENHESVGGGVGNDKDYNDQKNEAEVGKGGQGMWETISAEDIRSSTERMTSASPIARRLGQDEEYRAETLDEVIKTSEGKGGAQQGNSFGTANIPTAYRLEYLDACYRNMVSRLSLDDQTPRPNAGPLIYFGKRRLGPTEKIMPGRLRWSATRFSTVHGRQRMDLYAKTTPYLVPGGSDRLPLRHDLALILDSSSSMGRANNFGSPYSLLLRAVYSLLHHLRQTGNDSYMRFAVINFSDKTFYSGWQNATRLPRLRREFMLTGQYGGTTLNPAALRRMPIEAQRTFLAIMVTDGDLANERQVADAVQGLVNRGNEFILLNIGASGAFADRVRATGAEVRCLASAADLHSLILGKGRERWQ